MQQQQVCAVLSSSANSVDPKIPSGCCSAAWRSVGGTFPHRLTPLRPHRHPELFRLHGCELPREAARSLPPHLDAAASGCMLAAAEFPQLQGTVMTKLSKLIVEAALPKATERWRGHEPKHAVSCSRIAPRFVWADWKVLSC